MISRLTLLSCLLLFTAMGKSQCPTFGIEDLQLLLKTSPHLKEDAIRRHGFDLHQQWNERGSAFWRYNRCWYTTVGATAYFDQILLWNSTDDVLTFCTSNKNHYTQMRQSVEQRHAGQNGVFYGQVFTYRFHLRSLDGVEYYAVSMSLRQ